jgi:hypothetical protein
VSSGLVKIGILSVYTMPGSGISEVAVNAAFAFIGD